MSLTVSQAILALQSVNNPSTTMLVHGPLVGAAGDFTGGAAEDVFTSVGHGLVDGDEVVLVYKSAAGVVTGAIGDTFIVNQLTADTFQLTSDGAAVIENTADGTAVFGTAAGTLNKSGATNTGINSTDNGSVYFE